MVTSTHGACSSVALAGFALPECLGSSPRVYLALEGLTVVVHRGLVPPLLSGSTFYVHACHPRGVLPLSWPEHPPFIKKKKKNFLD